MHFAAAETGSISLIDTYTLVKRISVFLTDRSSPDLTYSDSASLFSANSLQNNGNIFTKVLFQ